MNELEGDLETVEAISIHPTMENFKPHVNSKGNIGTERNETPFQHKLDMKIGSKVMLTYNIDVSDCLTNGARGKIVAFEKNKSGSINKVIVRFENKCQGELKRSRDKKTEDLYPECTAIEKVMYQYSLGRKITAVSNTAKLLQFPLKLCFATTSHKFQGQTVVKPQKLIVDLRTVFAAAQAYVMLSRVQSIYQLYILESLPPNKLYADSSALKELDRLDSISINRNPPRWEKLVEGDIRIFSLNCQSLKSKIDHIRNDEIALVSHLMCFSETWLTEEDIIGLDIKGYKLTTNCFGKGRGLATYYRDSEFIHVTDVKENEYQMTKLKPMYIS